MLLDHRRNLKVVISHGEHVCRDKPTSKQNNDKKLINGLLAEDIQIGKNKPHAFQMNFNYNFNFISHVFIFFVDL